ncbi:hypothetical protein Tco_0476653, partial [Tanacetum coccineum]
VCWNSSIVQQVQAAPQWAMYCKVRELQKEGTEARGMVYALGGGETDQDLNNIKVKIEA